MPSVHDDVRLGTLPSIFAQIRLVLHLLCHYFSGEGQIWRQVSGRDSSSGQRGYQGPLDVPGKKRFPYGRTAYEGRLLVPLTVLMNPSELVRLLFVSGIDYLCIRCVDFFQILVGGCPGIYV